MRFARLSSAVFILLLAAAREARAVEVSLFIGNMIHSAISGCCKSSGSEQGFGVLGRADLGRLGEIELGGYSDARWNEAFILKPLYLIGRKREVDPISSGLISVRSVPNWRLLASVGLGYFSHTARTQKFDLPILLNGLTANNINQLLYSLDDRWSAGAIVEVSMGVSTSDLSLLIGTHLVVSHYF